jgi:hypothetical protein
MEIEIDEIKYQMDDKSKTLTLMRNKLIEAEKQNKILIHQMKISEEKSNVLNRPPENSALVHELKK